MALLRSFCSCGLPSSQWSMRNKG